MKLNVSEFRWILLNCNIMVGLYKGKQYAVIEPKFPKYQARLDFLLGSFSFPSIDEWNKLSRELTPKLKQSSQLRYQQALNKLAGMSDEKLTKLNNKQRIELLDDLLQDVIGNDAQTFKQNQQTIATYKEQLKILLFGIKLPLDFLKQELAKCEQFCHRLQSVPRLKEDLENWNLLENHQRRLLAENILHAFNGAYKTDISLKMFSENDWSQVRRPQGMYAQFSTAPTAYAEGSTVFVNKEKIALCHNLAVPALIFHEALHIARRQDDWSHFPLVDKLFESKFTYLALEGNELYTINPVEMNAYKMDEEVADFLLEKMKIKFVENSCPFELNSISGLTASSAKSTASSLLRADMTDKNDYPS